MTAQSNVVYYYDSTCGSKEPHPAHQIYFGGFTRYCPGVSATPEQHVHYHMDSGRKYAISRPELIAALEEVRETCDSIATESDDYINGAIYREFANVLGEIVGKLGKVRPE